MKVSAQEKPAQPRLDDIAQMWRYARDHHLAGQIKALHRPSVWRHLAVAFADWATIFAAFALVHEISIAFLPLTLLVIGNRQRALGNLMHDAAHGSTGGDRRRADLIARLVLFLPMFNSIRLYRRDHFAHHRSLGTPGLDVDLIHREEDMGLPWPLLWWRQIANEQNWKSSCLGHLRRGSRHEIAEIAACWTLILLAIAATTSPRTAGEFVLIWLLARASVFHAITMFREISDHVGMHPGGVMGFSRNVTSHGILAALIHPHHNGYHLAHHLNPAMPYYALPRAHALLLGWPDYAAAQHCDRYFNGETPLVKLWVRNRQP